MNSGRIPTKKRGRPRKELNRADFAQILGGSRNFADMVRAINRGLADDWKAELLPRADSGEVSMTTLGYVARFPPEQQRKMFDLLQPLGARTAKRAVECLIRRPTWQQIAERTLAWLSREFPEVAVPAENVAAACRFIADAIDQSITA